MRRGMSWVWLLALAFMGSVVSADESTPKDKPRDEDKSTVTVRVDVASAEDDEESEDPILRLVEVRLDEHVVPARMINLPLPGKTQTVQDLLDKFQQWSKDDKLGGVLLDISNLNLSLADVQELKQGLSRLREADKKVFAFLNAGTPVGYLLAADADEIATSPTGAVILPGVGRLFPYMKGHYQLLGVEYDVITCGRFKYPGFLNEREPNQYFKQEFDAILDSWIDEYKTMLADGRDLDAEKVTEIIDTALFSATQAQQRGLFDRLAYYDEYRDQVLKRERMKRWKSEDRGLAEVNSLQDFVGLINDQLKKAEEARKAVGPKIAVLHARGPIIDVNLGAGFASQVICRDDFIGVVDELIRNKSIKAVVMRVDSPGGSGYASDQIWKRLRELGDKKPLVVSMGTVAGSGGYYIACPAAKIFAQPTTITGSIGVLGVFQSSWSLFNRADVELAEMKRGARSTLGAPHRTLSKEDRAFIQKYMDDFYGVFVDRVAQTRRLPVERVREIAEGRIYTGRDAKEIGLVDELGGLEDAIQAAKEMAGIPSSAELKIVHYPRPSSLGEMFESLSAAGTPGLASVSSLLGPAKPVSFESQLDLFSQSPSVLCWMAVPPFWQTLSPLPDVARSLMPVETRFDVRNLLGAP